MAQKYDAVVIGSGPGGYVCAIRLAQLGKKTAIVEREKPGGVCLNVGCIPSKALIYAASQYWKVQHEFGALGIEVSKVQCDLNKLQKWKGQVVTKLTSGVSQLLKANGATFVSGEAQFVGPKKIKVKSTKGSEEIEADNFVIATGSRPVVLEAMPFNGKNILSSTEALELTELPKSMVVIGGGFIGLEIGIVYAKLGARVTIVEALDRVLAAIDPELVTVVTKKMKSLGIEILTSTKVKKIQEKDPASAKLLHLEIETSGKSAQVLEVEKILVSVGRRPNSDNIGLETLKVATDPKGNILTDNQGRTNVAGIWAIGDVNGAPQLAHRASMDGLLVAGAIGGERSFRDYRSIPWAVFSDPEIAVCGLSEEDAKRENIGYRVGRFPFAANGRALSTQDSEGFIKVLLAEKDESLLGVHIVGPEASNLIAEAALAIEMGACAEDLIRTIHTHPTLPEAFPEAVEAAYHKAIHIFKPSRSEKRPPHASA